MNYLLCVGFFCRWLGDGGSSRSSSQEIDSDETHSASATQSCSPAHDSLAPLRRRRASMQDALDFTKINASLYERPVSRPTAAFY